MISKFLGFPLVGLLLMALCLSLVACGDDDDEFLEQGIDPYGTYVGTYQSISKVFAPGGDVSIEMDPAPAQLLITKGLSQTKFLLLDDKGNVILAGHSGSGRTAYFKNLHKLQRDDEVSIFYNGVEYKYKVVNQYDIDKTGTANIVRNAEKSTLTLITCRKNTNKQIIYICELVSVA